VAEIERKFGFGSFWADHSAPPQNAPPKIQFGFLFFSLKTVRAFLMKAQFNNTYGALKYI